MVCGGFSCSRNTLISLNVLYIIVSFVLIGVAAYFRLAAVVVSFALVGGIITCGVFLFFIALIGLIGAVKHNQVLLFFYMIILFLLFLLQFSLGCACLAVNEEQELSLVRNAWMAADDELKKNIQNQLNCCGFEDANLNDTSAVRHPSCSDLPCCKSYPQECHCKTCLEVVRPKIHDAFSITGGVGLFFSFTEFIGVVLTLRYRNQKDPKANPNAFL